MFVFRLVFFWCDLSDAEEFDALRIVIAF